MEQRKHHLQGGYTLSADTQYQSILERSGKVRHYLWQRLHLTELASTFNVKDIKSSLPNNRPPKEANQKGLSLSMVLQTIL